MAARNADSITNAQGEVHPSVPRDEPLTTSGVRKTPRTLPKTLSSLQSRKEQNLTSLQHKPGILVGNDAAPEFSAKTLPAGSAPSDRTFQPNTTSEVPGQADNDNVLRAHGKESTHTTASSTLGGATSGDVHTGLGKPVQGQTSSDRGGGLAGVGASGAASGNQMVDEGMQPGQRGLEKEAGPKGQVKGTDEGADELPNASA
ncbi:MAG: hypothetical protein Q9182_004441 [Xanthomendoza sp. 2 TL-2023]